MAKAQAEDMRVKRRDMEMMAGFDPSQAMGGIEPLLSASNRWFESWVAMSSELLEFSRNRLDRNLEVGRAMARSSGIEETMDLQADYARSTLRDYFAEASKLADLGTRVMFDNLWSWQSASRGETPQRRDAA
ncbi:MAG TPA: phasin family protein [Stellaceae bacterium]|nr:phasin family protein [Stellaceae bacterium]